MTNWRGSSPQRFMWLSGLALAGVAVAMSAALNDGFQRGARGTWSGFGVPLASLESNAWWLIPFFVLASVAVLALSRMTSWFGGSAATNLLLEAYRSRSFQRAKDDTGSHHVTLFKHVRWNPWPFAWDGRPRLLGRPWGGWLMAVSSAGPDANPAGLTYYAPGDALQAGGVPGSSWAKRSFIAVQNLPDLTGEPPDEAVSTYASHTRLPKWWIRAEKPSARSLCAFPVETNGVPWGVLVFTSRDRDLDLTEIKRFHRDVAGVLGGVLGEA